MKIQIVAAYAVLTLVQAPATAAPHGEEPFTFVAANGARTEAWRGAFQAPENRSNPDSRKITIRYVRFPATGKDPGPPIVYLAGGPGAPGIGTAERARFPLFMAMREFGDVIALDQRGVGTSDRPPSCRSDEEIAPDRAWSDGQIVQLHRLAAEECAAFWKAQGVDLSGYTTIENARDLDALRVHLGAERISLWGISYGTHLALAAMRELEGHIERVVLASAEGLDQTVKLPAATDAYFGRLQQAVNSQPAAAAAYPDIAGMIRRVHARLEEKPLAIHIPAENGGSVQVLLTRPAMQLLASGSIADPQDAAQLLRLYALLDRMGEAAAAHPAIVTVGKQIARHIAGPIVFEAMPLAMDVASGVSPRRLALVTEQAKTALLGDYLNFPMPQLAGFGSLDLGEDFRAAPQSRVPTLLLTGTLDGRIAGEEQMRAVAGLTNLTRVTVVNAGHNLFMTTPEVTETIRRFMRGEDIRETRIIAPLPPLGPAGRG